MFVPAVALHVITGAAYLAVTALCAIDVGRLGRYNGDRAAIIPFSVVLGLVMFTTGIHHLDYAVHLNDSGRVSFGDFATIVLAVPAAAVWVFLRLERLRDNAPGRGDRIIHDHRPWIGSTVTTFVMTAAFLAGFTTGRAREAAQYADTSMLSLEPWWHYFPLMVTAAAFAYVAVRLWGQARTDYAARGYWSLSGLALAAVFATCANVHLVQAFNIMRGFTPTYTHTHVIEWVTATTAIAWVMLVRQAARHP